MNYTQPGYDISENNYFKGTTNVTNDKVTKGWPKNYYCAETMRSISIAFTNFFNDLHVVRKNEFGEPIKCIQVPIKFGPRMKSFDFRKQQESGKEYYISYPNLVWRFDGMSFDAERFSGQYADRVFYNDTLEDMGFDWKMTEQFWSDVQPVPYNINISMELKCDLINDAMDVVEQICTRFSPECYLNIKEFWFFNKRRSIKLTLQGDPSWQIESESMGEEDKREITVTFNFQAAAYLYKPIKTSNIIDKIDVYVNATKGHETWHEEIKGNYDGSLTNRYDFEDDFNCKVANVSALSRTYPTSSDKGDTIEYTTNFVYKEIPDEYQFYPEGTKFIKSKTMIWNKATSGYTDDTGKPIAPIIDYYEIPAWGKNPYGIKIEDKRLYDSNGTPYKGYYTKEFEATTHVLNDDVQSTTQLYPDKLP